MQDSLEPLQLQPFPMEGVPGEGETVVILTLIDNTDLTVNDARNPINGSGICILYTPYTGGPKIKLFISLI